MPKKGTRTGPDTSYMQQYKGLREQGFTNPDPRNQLFEDLTTLITEWTGRGYHPIVMGDLNTPPNDPELVSFMDKNGLYDIIADSNEGPPPPTYSRGQHRLNYILSDRHTKQAATKSGALGLHNGVLSDHTMQ